MRTVNKRRHPRVSGGSLRALVTIDGQPLPSTRVHDVSLGGALLLSGSSWPNGKNVLLELLRDGARPLRLIGRVIGHGPAAQQQVGVRVRFNPPSPRITADLYELINTLSGEFDIDAMGHAVDIDFEPHRIDFDGNGARADVGPTLDLTELADGDGASADAITVVNAPTAHPTLIETRLVSAHDEPLVAMSGPLSTPAGKYTMQGGKYAVPAGKYTAELERRLRRIEQLEAELKLERQRVKALADTMATAAGDASHR